MDFVDILFIVLLAIWAYIMIVYFISKAIASNNVNGHKPFWWVFFLGLFGAIIVILLDIRDIKVDVKPKEEKPKTKTKSSTTKK